MAVRPVFTVFDRAPYHSMFMAEFTWAGGFSVTQKRKNIDSMHRCFLKSHPGKRVLEISSKSTEEAGVSASAFFLEKFVPSLNRDVPVENIFQSSKVFRDGGPYLDLLEVKPIEAKRDERLKSSGPLIGFRFEGVDYPLVPRTAFYDFIYINALLEHPELAEQLAEYDGFTDIAYNPEKSLNCQARSAAIFVALTRSGKIDLARSFDTYLTLFTSQSDGKRESSQRKTAVPEENPQKEPSPEIHAGDTIVHSSFGSGTVLSVTDSVITIQFERVGEKKLGTAWAMNHCKIQHNPG